MSDDVREEMKKLKEEMAGLRDQLRSLTEDQGQRPKGRGMFIDIGSSVGDYVDEVMQGVAEGIHGELERSVFIGPRGCRMTHGHHEIHEDDNVRVDFAKTAEAMNALGHEHRLRILDELMSGGKYINELQEKLSDITTSTLSSHLDTLENAGLVVQEKMRGRYLITLPGRTAYKMARRVSRFLETREEE